AHPRRTGLRRAHRCPPGPAPPYRAHPDRHPRPTADLANRPWPSRTGRRHAGVPGRERDRFRSRRLGVARAGHGRPARHGPAELAHHDKPAAHRAPARARRTATRPAAALPHPIEPRRGPAADRASQPRTGGVDAHAAPPTLRASTLPVAAALPRLTPALSRPIRSDVIAEQYNQMIKYGRRAGASTGTVAAMLSRPASDRGLGSRYSCRSPNSARPLPGGGPGE